MMLDSLGRPNDGFLIDDPQDGYIVLGTVAQGTAFVRRMKSRRTDEPSLIRESITNRLGQSILSLVVLGNHLVNDQQYQVQLSLALVPHPQMGAFNPLHCQIIQFRGYYGQCEW